MRRRVRRVPGAVGALTALAGLPWAAAQDAGRTELQGHLVAELLVLFGCVFLLAAAIGMLRFPDFYTRLHASTKLVTLGGVGIFGGAAIAFAPLDATGRVLLIAGFFFLTAPLSGYMIARSGYLRGLVPAREEGSVDEWKALGAASASVGADPHDALFDAGGDAADPANPADPGARPASDAGADADGTSSDARGDAPEGGRS